MKNLTTLIVLCLGFLCQASPNPKDTIYTNVESLMKEVRTTQKKTATYYWVLKDDDKDVKVRIDLKQIDANIPIYKSNELDIKKLLALKEKSLEEPLKKFAEFQVQLESWQSINNEVETLKAEIESQKTGDSLEWDIASIDSIQAVLDEKNIVKNERYEAYEATFSEYEKMITDMLGDLKGQYRDRLSAALEEAYHKLENTETVFLTAQDAPTWHDVRINLIKLDARRSMKVNYIAREGKKKSENITAGKFYYILHFAEFGLFFPAKVQSIIDDIKEKEMKLNPYLTGERFALVCDNQDRTQDHISSVMNHWDYDLEGEERLTLNNPLKIMKLRKESNGYYKEHTGKFGCVRTENGRNCSHPDPNHSYMGKNKPHMGVDLLAFEGTDVFSSVNGTAYLYHKEISGYGKVISVKGKLLNLVTQKEEDVYVLYAHLKEISVENGDTVKVGDVIGKTGRSGNASDMYIAEEHLHLEILTEKWPSSKKGFNSRKPPLDYFSVINP